MLGGTAVYIRTEVPTRNEEHITCKFGRKLGVAKKIDRNLVVCVSPATEREGEVILQLQIGQRGLLESKFFYSKCIYERYYEVLGLGYVGV